MAYQAALALTWLLSLCDVGVLLTAAVRDELRERKKWILVRHGESINNILSQKHDPWQWYLENGPKNKQDPALSLEGRTQCTNAGQILFGKQRCSDTYHLFGGGAFNYSAVYVSPMRRTLETAFVTFGCAAHEAGIPFKALPWAHEARKSQSDVGLGSSVLVQFAKSQALANIKNYADGTEPLQTLTKTLGQLPEDWSTNPSVPSETLPYYPAGKKESDVNLAKRMKKLQSEMLSIPEEAAILVAHSGVIRNLLRSYVRNRKPDNAAMFYGELSSEGWLNVKLLGAAQPDHAPINGLPGFMKPDKAADCSAGNCDDFEGEFALLGAATKFTRGSCCKCETRREWVYDKVIQGLTFFKPDKNVQQDKARGTIHLKDTTTVWYRDAKAMNSWKDSPLLANALSGKGLKSDDSEHQLTCDKACPLDKTVKDVKNVIIFTEDRRKPKDRDYTCKQDGGCILVLRIGEHEKGQMPAALKIAIAVACSRNTTFDVATALTENECEPKQDQETFFELPVQTRARSHAVVIKDRLKNKLFSPMFRERSGTVSHKG